MLLPNLALLLFLTCTSSGEFTKLPESRLKCTEEYFIIHNEFSAVENQFKTFSIEINEPNSLLTTNVNEACEFLTSDGTRKRRSVGGGVFKSAIKYLRKFTLQSELPLEIASHVGQKAIEAWKNSLVVSGNVTFENSELDIHIGLTTLLMDGRLTEAFLHYFNIYKHIESDLRRTNHKTFLKTTTITNLRCDRNHDDDNYSIHFEMQIPRHDKLQHVRTCQDIGELDDRNYFYHHLENSLFWNKTGVFKVDLESCDEKNNIRICPSSAISHTLCSYYEPENCTLFKKSLKLGIFRELPMGWIIYGSAKHLLKTNLISQTATLFGVRPHTLLYLNPGKGEIFQYAGHKLKWKGGESIIEEF